MIVLKGGTYLTTLEVAAQAGVSPQTVRNRIRDDSMVDVVRIQITKTKYVFLIPKKTAKWFKGWLSRRHHRESSP